MSKANLEGVPRIRWARAATRWVAILFILVYLFQIAIVLHARLVPDVDITVDGKRYVVVVGTMLDFFPLFGLSLLLVRQPCALTITDLQTGEVTVDHLDLPRDVFDDYPILKSAK